MKKSEFHNDEFRKFIKNLRKEKNESQQEMADNLRITRAYLSALENGKKSVGNKIVEKIASCYPLNKQMLQKLNNAVIPSSVIKFPTKNLNELQIEFLAKLFKRYEDLSDEEIKKLLKYIDG